MLLIYSNRYCLIASNKPPGKIHLILSLADARYYQDTLVLITHGDTATKSEESVHATISTKFGTRKKNIRQDASADALVWQTGPRYKSCRDHSVSAALICHAEDMLRSAAPRRDGERVASGVGHGVSAIPST
jgi:hypothetical protein